MGKGFQMRVTHRLLPRGPKYNTFPTEKEAYEQGRLALASLDEGIIPRAWADAPEFIFTNIAGAIREYRKATGPAESTDLLLSTIAKELGETSMKKLTTAWADEWIKTQKLSEHRTPNTIRHHVGALSRCLSWVVRTHPDHLIKNPLADLPRGYSTFNEVEQRAIRAQGIQKVPKDSESVNRLRKSEEVATVKVLTERIESAKKAEMEGKPRDDYFGHSAVDWHTGALLIFLLALESCMRMREMYTLSWNQVGIEQYTVWLDKTKNGDSREVPLNTPARRILEAERERKPASGDALVFPFWNGAIDLNGEPDKKVLRATTSTVSTYFGRVFNHAGCGHFNFHDTRSEAICRLVLYTPPDGIKLTDVQVSRITGHRDLKMLRRYMRLRGSELSKFMP
jgi:integrase